MAETRLFGSLCLVSRIFFFDTGCFAAKVAQVIKLCTPHFAASNHVDVIDDRGMQREYSLDAHAKTYLADGYGFTCSAVLSRYHDALKDLQAFLVAFLNADMYFDGITRLKRRDVLP